MPIYFLVSSHIGIYFVTLGLSAWPRNAPLLISETVERSTPMKTEQARSGFCLVADANTQRLKCFDTKSL